MSDEMGRRAGAAARRAGTGFSPPDLAGTIRRRRRTRVLGAIFGSALALAAAVGVGAFFMRTVPDVAPVDTTTTTSPQQTASTTTVTTSPETTTTAASLATEPGYGGIVKVAAGIDMISGYEDVDGRIIGPTINPLLNSRDAAELARLVVPGAYRVDPTTGEPSAWVVDPLPTVSNGGVAVTDGTATVTCQINADAVWGDGTPITAEDFVFTHELIMSEDQPIDRNLRELHSLIDGATLKGDGKTLSFTLTRPDPRYIELFPWLVPTHAVDRATFADDWNDQLWLSGGPFVFDGYEPTPTSEVTYGVMHLSRNDTYWETDTDGNPLPYLDGIELQAVRLGVGNGPLAAWFSERSVDAVLPALVYRYDAALLGNPDERGFVLAEVWDSLIEVVGFELRDTRLEVNPDSLNHQLLYRQAVLRAIDRSLVSDETGFPVARSIAGTASPGMDIDVWQQYDNHESADQLLAQLGEILGRDFTTSPPVSAYTTSSADETVAIGDAVAAQLEEAGWQVTTEYSGDFFNSNLAQGLNDIYAVRLFAGEGVAELAHQLSAFDPTLPEAQKLFDWSALGAPAERFAEVIAEAQATLDRQRLGELVVEAESILADNAIVYPLVRRQVFLVPYWPERVQGVIPHQGWTTATAAWWWSPAQAGDASP